MKKMLSIMLSLSTLVMALPLSTTAVSETSSFSVESGWLDIVNPQANYSENYYKQLEYCNNNGSLLTGLMDEAKTILGDNLQRIWIKTMIKISNT